MRLKPQPRTTEVGEVKGTPNDELAERCPEQRTMFPTEPCPNQSCPWAISGALYMNCSFVVFEAVGVTAKKLSLEEIGEMVGITREGVRQIEKRAMKKVRLKLLRGCEPKPPVESAAVAVESPAGWLDPSPCFSSLDT